MNRAQHHIHAQYCWQYSLSADLCLCAGGETRVITAFTKRMRPVSSQKPVNT